MKKTIIPILVILISFVHPQYEELKLESNTESIISSDLAVTKNEISACPNNMVEIKGDYCNSLEEICLKYGDPDNKGPNGPVQCLEFKNPTKCVSSTTPMHFCIDKTPYPYSLDKKPTTNITWYDAKKICEDQGKRLCGRKEYTQACRGPENKPYPYGYVRDCTKCNCDRTPWLAPSTHSFKELDRRVTINEILECKSDYGVIGLVGNNDRWVYNESESPYKSALVGGHAIKGARNRCSVATLAHNEYFKYYEVATPVCCLDIK